MKKQNTFTIIAVSVLLLLSVTGCQLGSSGSSNFSSETDKFSIVFPSGASDVKTETTDRKYAKSSSEYSKNFDNRSPNYRNYAVEVLELEPLQTAGKSPRQIQEIALNGWEKEPDTIVAYDIKFNGETGLDSSYGITIGSVSMWFRQAVFYSESNSKLYAVKISASKKDNLFTKEATDFINSFKLSGKGWF